MVKKSKKILPKAVFVVTILLLSSTNSLALFNIKDNPNSIVNKNDDLCDIYVTEYVNNTAISEKYFQRHEQEVISIFEKIQDTKNPDNQLNILKKNKLISEDFTIDEFEDKLKEININLSQKEKQELNEHLKEKTQQWSIETESIFKIAAVSFPLGQPEVILPRVTFLPRPSIHSFLLFGFSFGFIGIWKLNQYNYWVSEWHHIGSVLSTMVGFCGVAAYILLPVGVLIWIQGFGLYGAFATYYHGGPPTSPYVYGQSLGNIGERYEYSFGTSEPDNDDVFYYIDWGDGTDSGWIGPYSSEKTIKINHTWDESNTYEVKAKAKDIYGYESNWSDSLEINIRKFRRNTIIVEIFEELIERICRFIKIQN